jgi:choice-of-anchor B domain-containing protein
MRSLQRTLLCATAFVLAFFGASVSTFIGFGGAVLVGDGEVFVGEAANQFRPGTVYVYRKGGAGWQEAGSLTGPNAAVGDQFGSALAHDGTRLFVGAGPAAVHVFTKQGTTWTLSGSVASSAVSGDNVRFGRALAATGDWLFVGREIVNFGRGGPPGGLVAPGRGGEPPPPPPAGAVYVFKRNASGQYAHHSTLTSSETTSAGDNFGSSISVASSQAGDVVIVGASGQANRAGVVHEFGLDAEAWRAQRSFAPVGVQGGELFGSNLMLTGDQAVVTAPGDAGGYGAVYVFRRIAQTGRGGRGAPAAAAGGANVPAPQPGAAGGQGAAPGGNFTWIEVARLAAPSSSRADQFAATVASTENEVWVGAPRAGGPGRVFVFPGNATGFQIDGFKLLGPNWTDPVAAGGAISVRGNVAAVGAAGANRRAGGVLIYERDGFGVWREQPMITTPVLDELPAITGGERRCSGSGKVEVFDCGAADLLSFLPPSRLSYDGHYIELSSLWGWTDSQTKHEWALLGRRDGTTFVDITDPTRPIAVADLPLTDGARPSAWREMKTYKDHAFIVSDGAGPHGMQIFDLTRLRTMKPQPNGLPQKVEADLIYRNVNSVHDMVINEESGFAYPVGSSSGGTTCGGGLHMIDIREPKNPKFVGCFADTETGRARTGYIHDAQCVNYKGPDKRYKGHEICIGSNETAISIQDVTDKSKPRVISRATYPKVGYTHQGWLTEDHRYFYLDDELDETGNMVDKTRTLVFDFIDLENPKLVKEHMGVEPSSDHNQYVKGDLLYQANYRSGVRILSIKDPTNPKEIAFFDTDPFRPNTAGFNGAWNVFPFFKSGTIIVSSIEQGLFMIRTADR